MRWAILWLTAALIPCNSANYLPSGSTNVGTINQVDPDHVANIDRLVDEDDAANTEDVSTDGEDVDGSLTENPDNPGQTGSNEDESAGNTGEEGTSDETNVGVENPPVGSTESEEGDNSVAKLSSESSESAVGGNPEAAGESGDLSTNSGQLSDEDLVVTTKSGEVQGYVWQDKENIISYIDIPYGSVTSPFQMAAPIDKWEERHIVKDHNKRCPQLEGDTYVGNIDCLTLSIFKPLNAEAASVLFHIHSENFITGSGDPSIYGPDYLVANGIILVLPNYRLGPLGFLCMQNETAPGNIALKDLSLALDWIKNNIAAFGGNPNNIAVSGEGRSGALAGLLALYPMSKKYVNKVIAESGSFLSFWALDRDPLATAAKLQKKLEGDEQNIIDITLPNVDVQAIVTAAKGIEFKPCLEKNESESAFMTDSPFKVVTTEKFEEITLLLGSAALAGVHEALLQTEESVGQMNEDVSLLLPDDLSFSTVTSRRQVGERVKRQYFGDDDISLNNVTHLSLCYTDMGYLGPGIRSARLMVEAGATVYFYEFAYVGRLNRVLQSVNRPIEGAMRGDIIGYLFTQDGVVPGEELSEESKVVASLTEMWTNFLKSGEPSIEGIEWNNLEKVDEEEEEWLLIDAEPSTRKGLHMQRLPLWTEIYQNHFIEESDGHDLSPSVYTLLIFQLVFWIGFCRNAPHMF